MELPLNMGMMAELFDCTIENIIFHFKNIYLDGELDDKSTTKEYLVVQKEGKREVQRMTKYYLEN